MKNKLKPISSSKKIMPNKNNTKNNQKEIILPQRKNNAVLSDDFLPVK